jgi:hypothetical protein
VASGLVRTASVIGLILVAGHAIPLPADAQETSGLLPLGDGKLSSTPEKGSVFACQSRFGGGGAQRAGSWISGSHWNPRVKPVVDGEVRWPNAHITISREGDRRVIRANNLPRHPTGIFPIGRRDDAFQYDRNPNHISERDVVLSLPADPKRAAQPSCVPMGLIGVAVSGTAIFNALDGMGRDAPAHEIQDKCGGHPERSGQYHYHDLSPCLTDPAGAAGRHSDLLGYVLDGFGIYGPRGEGGKAIRSSDLDTCHGHGHPVDWDGRRQTIYHYHFTADYPYSVGCFRGTALQINMARPRMDPDGRGRFDRPGGRRPTGLPGAGGVPTFRPPPIGGPGRGDGNRNALDAAARELGVAPQALRRALGPPPPDFAGAARHLGIDETQLRDAMSRARRAAGVR